MNGVIKDLFRPLKVIYINHRFRKKNRHNEISIIKYSGPSDVENYISVGKYTYGKIRLCVYNRNDGCLKIGSYVSIANNVSFMLGGIHPYNHIGLFPFRRKLLKENLKSGHTNGDIVIESDAWIGEEAMIMSGIRIGQGSIVGARALVTKNVPPYAIVGGVPAKIIKYRFSENIIRELLKIKYDYIDENNYFLISDLFSTDINDDNIREVVEQINCVLVERKHKNGE